jgi:phage terminase large subunit GpA-like protein
VNPKRARNEVLDCTVYAIFCTHALSLHTYTEKMWARLEAALEPDLFGAKPAPTAATAAAEPAMTRKDEGRHGNKNTARRDW